MDVYYSKNLSHAFVVGPADLRKLIELLQKRIGKADIRVDCVDNIKRKFKTVKELIAYENSKSKRIRRIHLSAESNDYSKSVTIVFHDPSWLSAGISIDIKGREDVVSRLRDEILDIVAGMRPWYSWIARADLVTIFGIVYLTLFFIFQISILFEWISVSDSPASTSSKAKGTAIGTLFGICFLLSLWGLHRFRGFLFPRIVFTIGQEESRFKILEKVHWGVVIAFFVSLVAGLVLLIL